MRKIGRILSALAILMVAGMFHTAHAQIKDTSMTLENDFRALLGDIEKPEIAFSMPGVKVNTEGVTFEEKDFKVNTSFVAPRIRLVEPPKPVWPTLYNNMVKAGFGRYSTPLLDVYLHNGRDDDSDLGIEFHHLNSFNGHLDYADFREDWGSIGTQYHLRKVTAGAKAMVYNTSYYHYADTIVRDRPDLKDTISQSFTKVAVDAFMRKNPTADEPNFSIPFQFRGFFDKYKNQDMHFSVLPTLGWNITKNISADATSNLTFSNTRFDTVEQTRFFLDFSPTATLSLERVKLTAGLKVNSYADSSSRFKAFPLLHGEFNVVPEKLKLVGGLKGEMRYNKFYNLVKDNRWLMREANVRPTIEKFHFYAGIEGNFAKYFNYTARFAHRTIENQLIYGNTMDGAYFTMLWDSSFVLNTATFGLGMNRDDKLKAGVNAEIRSFTTSNIAANFNIPTTQLDVWASYNFGKKVYVRTDVYFYGKRVMALDTLGQELEQSAQAIVDLYADYRFSERISVFLELNNMLNVRYYRWYNYQERPFDIKGGVTFSF